MRVQARTRTRKWIAYLDRDAEYAPGVERHGSTTVWRRYRVGSWGLTIIAVQRNPAR